MRVIQILCAGRYGGAEAVACALTEALGHQSGIHHSMLYLVDEIRADQSQRAALRAQIRDWGIDIRWFETDRRLSPALLKSLRDALKEDHADCIHAHNYKAALYAKATGLPTAFTLHGFDRTDLKGRTFVEVSSRLAVAAADSIVAVSSPIAQIASHWPGAGSIAVIPNAIMADPIPRAVAKRRFAAQYDLPKGPWTLAAGRLVPIKRLDRILDAWAKVAHGSTLLIAGDGPEKATLQRRADPQVRFLGHIKDMSTAYAAADVFILGSDNEGCPMAVLEAMSHGCPVVATAVGGVPDVLGDDGGILVPPTVDGLATGWASLLHDPELRQRWGDAAKRRSQAFTPSTWAARHLTLYRALLKSYQEPF